MEKEQVDAIFEVLKEGNDFINDWEELDFEGASVCEAIDSIIEHLEASEIEAAMGLHTDDGWQASLPHKAMHWGLALGIGIALKLIKLIGEAMEE